MKNAETTPLFETTIPEGLADLTTFVWETEAATETTNVIPTTTTTATTTTTTTVPTTTTAETTVAEEAYIFTTVVDDVTSAEPSTDGIEEDLTTGPAAETSPQLERETTTEDTVGISTQSLLKTTQWLERVTSKELWIDTTTAKMQSTKEFTTPVAVKTSGQMLKGDNEVSRPTRKLPSVTTRRIRPSSALDISARTTQLKTTKQRITSTQSTTSTSELTSTTIGRSKPTTPSRIQSRSSSSPRSRLTPRRVDVLSNSTVISDRQVTTGKSLVAIIEGPTQAEKQVGGDGSSAETLKSSCIVIVCVAISLFQSLWTNQ